MPKFETVTEGKVKFYVSKGKISKKLPVFYNPAKEFDRALSVIFLKATKKKTVLDLLAASGARGLRLAKEAKAKVTYNDISKEAIAVLKKNLKLNKLPVKNVFNMTANNFLGQCHDKFDFIDIDPFGSPILYVFNSIKRIDKNGILAVTATDTAPLFGVFKWTCFRKYGAFPLHSPIGHEVGIRILAKSIIEMGAKWNISLIPIFSHVTQYYYRIYFQASRAHLQKLLEKIGFIHYCSKCKKRFSSGFTFPEKCSCGNKLQSAGPLYLGNLWDTKVINEMQKQTNDEKILGFLGILEAESKIDVPYYYETEDFFKIEPKIEEVIAKIGKHFPVSHTHFSQKGFRTTANFEEIRKILS